MEKKISDMMDHILDDTVDIQILDIASSKKIKEETMSKLYTKTDSNKRVRKTASIILIAAVIALALSASAFAICQLCLEGLKGPAEVFPDDNMLSLVSIQGTTQYAAATEWEGYVQAWYDAGENMVEPGMETDEYFYYHAITQEARDTLDALLKKYDLKMHSAPTNANTLAELYSTVGISGFMPAIGETGDYPVSGTIYDDGTFSFNCTADLSGAGSVSYQFYSFGKDYFTRGIYMFEDRLESPEEWQYTTADGVDVLLALGEYKSILAVDMDNCFIFVNIMSGKSNETTGTDGADASYGMPTLDKAALEVFAESFDFTAINGLSA